MSRCRGEGQADDPEKSVDLHKGGFFHGLMLDSIFIEVLH
jgi:hypothetical protein